MDGLHMKRLYQILIIATIVLTVLFISCSELKNDLPTATVAGSQIHGQGWIDSASANFHGLAIQSTGWSMTSCQKCHGTDYRGGSSRTSCLTCHTKSGGPENCTVCHGSTNAAPPKDLAGNTSVSSGRVGAHQSHLIGSDTLAAAVACNECHIVPASLSSVGHIDLTAGAEVNFNGTVVTSSLASLAGSGLPVYAPTILQCANTYCHGYFPNGNKQSVAWKDVSGQARACGSCHGDVTKSSIADKALPKTAPGGTHPNDNRCYNCHTSVIGTNYKLNVSKHLNGRIDFN
jgi:predicted CxxxxCH...CXXCH cytochrome family protein